MSRRKLPAQDDLFQIRYVTDAVLSPDKHTVAYTLSETTGSGKNEKQTTSIWLTHSEGGAKARRLTQGKGSSYHPRFSHDGTELFFVSTRTDVPQVFVINVHGGEAEQITHLPQGVGSFDLSPDGKNILFAALSEPPVAKDENQHQRIQNFWYRFDPLGSYLADFAQTVFIQKRGGKPKAVSAAAGIVLATSFSPDGKEILILRSGLPQHKIFEADLVIAQVSGKGPERVLVTNTVLMSADWGHDSQTILCTGPGKDLAHQTSVFVINTRTGQMQDRTRALDLMVGSALQIHIPVRIASRVIPAADGRDIYTTVTRGGEAHVNKIRITGRRNALPLAEGQCVNHLMARDSHRSLVIQQSAIKPPELYWIDDETGSTTQLTHHNQNWHSKFRWPDVERVLVKSAPGVEIEGWVLKPKHVRAPCKTILTIHGGPHAGYGCGFWTDMHELVSAGYVVAFMNPRGSTGYGENFCRAILGRWGDPELKDFNAFLNHLIKQGITHPGKIGVTGISGGGHLSAWLIGHTNRFKAAVPEQGVYSMISMWGTSDAGRELLELELGGAPHKFPMRYWQQSPIAHAHKCKTPTLLLQGEDDIRCPMEQAEQMFATLSNHDCDVELIPMKRCSHGEQVQGRPQLRRFRMEVLKDWFDRHIS